MFKELLNKIRRQLAKALYIQIEELEEEVAKVKTELEELKRPDIQIDLQDDSEFSATPKSIRINTFVWEDWQKFCEANEEYSKKQLVSMALKEFMEKHK